MSSGTSKTLNNAFVRAYAKNGTHESTIPTPHAFRTRRRAPDSSNKAPPATSKEASPTVMSEGSAIHTASNIPAPHIAFPSTFATATEHTDLPYALLINQIDTAFLLDDSLTAALAPVRSQPTTPTPHRETHSAPARSTGVEKNVTFHAPQPPLWEAPRYEETHEDSGERSYELNSHSAPPVAPSEQDHGQEQEEQSATPVMAAWEVDHFGWTDECNHLFDELASAFDEAGEQLRAVTAEGLHVLAVSSTYRGEGRTLVATLLARAAARAGVKVALLDADIDNPQLGAQLKVQLDADWVQALDGNLPLEEVAVAALEENIVAYPLLAAAREKSVRLQDQSVQRLLQEVASRTDLVIIDLGPYTSDQRRMFPSGSACPVNAAIVVRDARSTSDEQAKVVAQALRRMGVEAVGIAENFVRD